MHRTGFVTNSVRQVPIEADRLLLNTGFTYSDSGVVMNHSTSSETAASALPLYSFRIPAGFPSPAQDHLDRTVSIDELLKIRAPHTYLAQVEGDSMIGAGIHDGDLLVVDRSLDARPGQIIVAAINGEPLVKRLQIHPSNRVALVSENPKYPPRYVAEGDTFEVWGVVVWSLRNHVRP